GADDDQQPLLEQDLKGAGVCSGSEDGVPDRRAVVVAQREALDPSEDGVADSPQSAESDADRDVHVPGADRRVGHIDHQRRRDDRGDLCGLRPGPHVAREPSGIRLVPQNAVYEDGQWPRLEQVYPDPGEEKSYRKTDTPGVGSEVAESSYEQPETRNGRR